MFKFLYLYIFILVYLVRSEDSQEECLDELMTIEKSEFFVEEQGRRIIKLDKKNLRVFDFSISRKFDLEINFNNLIINTYGRRFYYALTVKNNWVFESLEERLSILQPHNTKKFNFARHYIEMSNCRHNPISRRKEASQSSDNVLSFLFNLCNVGARDVNLFILKKDDPWIGIKVNEMEEKDLVLTIEPILNLEDKIVDVDYVSINKSAGVLDRKKRFKLIYESKINHVNIPKTIKNFLRQISYLFYYFIDGQKYLVTIQKKLTYIYRLDNDFLLDMVQHLLKNEDASRIQLPPLVDYFPNNFYFACGMPLCLYPDIDVIFKVNESNLIAIKGENYYDIKLGKQFGTPELGDLVASKFRPLKTYLESLIEKSHFNKTDDGLYKEFIGLKNLDAGDYLEIDEHVKVFFLIKDNHVYQLVNRIQNNKIDQKLTKLELKAFFKKSVNKTIQSVFTIFYEKKLIVLLADGTLIQFSYSNYLTAGLVELEDDLVIDSTFDKISASFTHNNLTYIFTKQNYQVLKSIGKLKKLKPYKKIHHNFFKPCSYKVQPIDDLIKPTFSIYKPNTVVQRPNSNQKSAFVNFGKLVIKSIALLAFLALVISLIIMVFINKKMKKPLVKDRFSREEKEEIEEKEDTKKSLNDSLTNLSNIFDATKTEKTNDFRIDTCFKPKVTSTLKSGSIKEAYDSMASICRLSSFKANLISELKSGLKIEIENGMQDNLKYGFKSDLKGNQLASAKINLTKSTNSGSVPVDQRSSSKKLFVQESKKSIISIQTIISSIRSAKEKLFKGKSSSTQGSTKSSKEKRPK